MPEITEKKIKTVKDLIQEITSDVIETLAKNLKIHLSQDDLERLYRDHMFPAYYLTYDSGFDNFLLGIADSLNPITQACLNRQNAKSSDDEETKLCEIAFPIIESLVGNKLSIEDSLRDFDESENVNIIVRWNERYFSIAHRDSSYSPGVEATSKVLEVVPRKIEIIRFFPKEDLK